MKNLIITAGSLCCAVAAQAQQKPNILLILADDMRGTTLGAMGCETALTPNLDALAGESLLFTGAHIMGGTNGAVSMPSRAMLMTGKYLYTLEKQGAVIPKSQTTLGEALQTSGYATCHIGKWHSDYKSFNRTFTGGTDIFFGGMADHWNVPLYHYQPDGNYSKKRPVIKDFAYTNQPEYLAGEYMYSGKHSVDIFTESACEFLKNRTAERNDSPFFLSLAYMSPHDPRTVPPRFDEMYEGADIPLPPNFMEKHPFDNGELIIRDEQLAATPRNETEVKRHIRDYYAMITHLDDAVGQVIAALKASGQYDNTIIVFAADNGLAVGQHGLMGKQNVYEHSVGIPLMIKFAGGENHTGTTDKLCYLIDLFPTLCEMTGTQIPESVDGTSLMPVIRKDKPVRDYLYYAYRGFQRAVSDGTWKLAEYHVKGVRTTRLFNLKDDPFECRDLSGEKKYASVIKRLREQMMKEKERTCDDSPFWNDFVF